MNELARSGIRQLHTDHGVDLDAAADLGVILHIVHLARRVNTAGRELLTEAILNPARLVGNVTLRRPSIGIQSFLQDKIREWYADDDTMMNLSFAYCLAHAAEPEKVWAINNPAKWRKIIKAWQKGLECRLDELMLAIGEFNELEHRAAKYQIQRQKETAEAEDAEPEAKGLKGAQNPRNLGPMIEILVHEYGHDGEYWVWRSPEGETEAMIQGFLDRQDQAQRGESKKAVAPNPNRDYIRNLREFKLFIRGLGEKRSKR